MIVVNVTDDGDETSEKRKNSAVRGFREQDLRNLMQLRRIKLQKMGSETEFLEAGAWAGGGETGGARVLALMPARMPIGLEPRFSRGVVFWVEAEAQRPAAGRRRASSAPFPSV